MGIMSTSFSCTRFRITDQIPAEIYTAAADILRRFAFKSIDDIPEEQSTGWVNIDDMLDSAWAVSPPEKGAYLAFALRIDTRRVPTAVLQKELEMALAKEEAANRETGKKYISRERKKELKDQVEIRLMQRVPPTPKVYDVVWNTESGVILFGSTGTGESEAFQQLFTRSFDTHLETLTPYGLAMGMIPDAATALDNLEPTRFA